MKKGFLVISLMILSFGLVSCCTMNVEDTPQYIDFSIQNVGNKDVHFSLFNKITKNIDQVIDIPKNKVIYFYDFIRDMDTYEYSLVVYKDDAKPFAWENFKTAMAIDTFISGTWSKDNVKQIKVDVSESGQYSFYCQYVPKNPN